MVIHEVIRAEGEAELARPAAALFWSGLAAGLSMGFSFAARALLRDELAPATWSHAVASLGYALGFLIVVLGRQQLFTESTLTAVLPVFTSRDMAKARAMLRLWAIVLAANLLGTWLFASALAYMHPFGAAVTTTMRDMAGESVADSFAHTALRSVFAGWLIALMVWLLPSADHARFFVIAALTWAVALGRLSHVIAGSTEAAYGVLTSQFGFGRYLVDFLVPTLLGNITGGVALVALLNHAPISTEMEGAGLTGAMRDQPGEAAEPARAELTRGAP
jgi:formate/nitrite transporter FocA (FNT family)